MSDTNKPVAFELDKGANPPSDGNLTPGQTPVNPPAGQDLSNAAQPIQITREEIQRLANEAALQAEERAYKRAINALQATDKRITGKVQAGLTQLEEMIKMQKSAGIDISPQQEAQLRNQVISNAYSQTDPSPTHTEQLEKPNPEAPSSGVADPITVEAWRLMEAAGIIINDDDPEAEKLDQSGGYAFLRSIEAAIETKRQRIASTPMQTPGRTPTGAGATGQHQANPIQNITDPDELFRMAKAQGLL